MSLPLPNIVRQLWPFRPEPFLITPRNEEEKRYGRATLLTPGDIAILLAVLREKYPDCTDLIDKLKEL